MRDIINLLEDFNPRITGNGGSEEYQDGSIHADVSPFEDGIVIHTFSSRAGGKGNGRRALAWMKQTFGSIVVNDPGVPSENPDSFTFWKKMADEGLISRMEDEYGDVIYDNGQWTIPENEREYYEGFI